MLESDVRPTVARQILSMHILINELKMGLGQVHAHNYMNSLATKCVTTLSKRKLGYFRHTLRKEHIRTGDLSKSM